ncbi:gamma-glutamyl-gamma-aminobutyrate hydrolase family protein [Trinickia sp. NRRL B-1857]|uniref:gamma-glutamyl-gamma-aminobutyrate hydrolase family protein n=1 Tax=Trinickia sp. NRRL B-1857 TaxID=3162879 RepID=UPI003D287A05
MLSKPLIGVTADTSEIGMHLTHVVGDKYLTAVVEGADALALAVPALGERQSASALLHALDGLLFTGSHSNVEPRHYGGPASAPGTLHDPARDATALPLLVAAVELGVPVLAICRGFQEMNVAFGGTLHQNVHAIDGHDDHRENLTDPLDVQYGPAHSVRLCEDGLLHSLAGASAEVRVNSLHAQGVDALAPALVAEAVAPDGLIEAARVAGASAFALGVQWHPEWRYASDPLSSAIFRAFGAACLARHTARASARG